jgi:hypothetical protein
MCKEISVIFTTRLYFTLLWECKSVKLQKQYEKYLKTLFFAS